MSSTTTKPVRKFVRKIVTHLHPHLDEYLAIFLIKKFGKEYYELSPDLTYGYISTIIPPGTELVLTDHLFPGVAGGELDDHGKNKKFSCCELVANKIRLLETYPFMAKIVQVVSKHDKERGSHRTIRSAFPKVISLMHRYGTYEPVQRPHGSYRPDQVMSWVEYALQELAYKEYVLYCQIRGEVSLTGLPSEKWNEETVSRFMSVERIWSDLAIEQVSGAIGDRTGSWLTYSNEARETQQAAFNKAKQIVVDSMSQEGKKFVFEQLGTRFGRLRILAIESDKEFADCELEFDSVSRTPEVQAHIVILRNSRGHTLIACNANFKAGLRDFMGKIRIVESQYRDNIIPLEICEEEGTLYEFPTWHIHEGIGYSRLYNGTTTRPHVEPSMLSFEAIIHLLVQWIALAQQDTAAA